MILHQIYLVRVLNLKINGFIVFLFQIFNADLFSIENNRNTVGHLSIADILYSGHILITDTFSGNGLIKNLIENLFLVSTFLQRKHFLGLDGVRYREVLLYNQKVAQVN